jgi:ubiquinone/menaquinone biosynthesis C-methylase UbiE
MNAKSPDRTEAGRNWASPEVAEQWSRRQARRDKTYGPATEMMLDLARISAGDRVLDIAAGTGDQTLLAARRVGPDGYVLATDLSAAMLKVAAEAAREAGLTNIETRVMNAQSLDLEADSFNVVISRLGLMLFSDPRKALKEIRRVLKGGGKFAALVFSTPEKNPYQGLPLAIACRLGGTMSAQFSLSEPGVLEEAFTGGGFQNITVHPVSFRRHFSSVADAIQNLRGAIFIREAMANLGNAEREQAWVEIERTWQAAKIGRFRFTRRVAHRSRDEVR